MTLIVGSIHDQQITLVADTKITYDAQADETRTRRELLQRPLLKLMVVSPTFVVGFAGDLPADLSSLYQAIFRDPTDADATIEVLRERSRRFSEVFIAATLVPRPTMWRIRDGAKVSTSDLGRLPIGDLDAYEYYMKRETASKHPTSAVLGEPLALQAIIQWFANVDDGPTARGESNRAALQNFTGNKTADFDRTVGGYVTQVVTTPSGFRYEPITQRTEADRFLYNDIRVVDRQLVISGRAVENDGHFRFTFGGGPLTRRAIGFCLPEARTGVLYPDGRPWDMKLYNGLASAEEFVERAWLEHGQMLLAPRNPTYAAMSFAPDPEVTPSQQ